MDRASWGATPPPQTASKQWGASPPTTVLAPALPTASPPDDLKGRLGPAVIGAGWAVPPLHKKPSRGLRQAAEANASDQPHSGWGPAPASEPSSGWTSSNGRMTAPTAPNARRRPSELEQMDNNHQDVVQQPLAQNRATPRIPNSRGFENASWRSASGELGRNTSGDMTRSAAANGWADPQRPRASSVGGWAVPAALAPSPTGSSSAWDTSASATTVRAWPDAGQGSGNDRSVQRTSGTWAEPRPSLPTQSNRWGTPPLPDNRNQQQHQQHRDFTRTRDESSWNPSPGWAPPAQEVYNRWGNAGTAPPSSAERTSWHAESAPQWNAVGDEWQPNHLDVIRGPYRDDRDLRPATRGRDAFAATFVDDIAPEVVSLSALKSDRDFDDYVPSSVISLDELMSDEPGMGSSKTLRSSDQRRHGDRQQRDVRKTKSSQVLRDSVDRDGSTGPRSVTMGRAAGREARGLNHEMKGVPQGRDPLRGERSHGNLRDAANRSANSRGGQLPAGSRPSGRLFGRQMEEVNKSMETFHPTPTAKPMRNRRSQQELKEASKSTTSGTEIHIKGLPKWVRARELLEVFSDYGAILNVGIKSTEGDKASACISFEEPGCAEEAVRALKTEIFFKMSRPLSMKLQHDAASSDSLPRSSTSGSPAAATGPAAARGGGDTSTLQSRKSADPNTPLDFKTLHIALIPASVDKSDLEKTFSPHGEIKRAQIVARTNKRSFAFISFKTEQAAEAALQDMKTRKFFGMHELLRVDYAHLAVSKRGGGGGSGGGNPAPATVPEPVERRSSTRRERRAARTASAKKDSGDGSGAGGVASTGPASSVEPSDSDESNQDESKSDEEGVAAVDSEPAGTPQVNVGSLEVASEVKDADSKADNSGPPSGGATDDLAIECDHGSQSDRATTLDGKDHVMSDVDTPSSTSDLALPTPSATSEPSVPAVAMQAMEFTKPENNSNLASMENPQPENSSPEPVGAAPDAASSTAGTPEQDLSRLESNSDASASVASSKPADTVEILASPAGEEELKYPAIVDLDHPRPLISETSQGQMTQES
ncbi:hypothetical protein HDU86_002164 [Geranomyces michiganensis]|nr:hypothetical protein HDU86_002164 [Geranomyces michiganensis]